MRFLGLLGGLNKLPMDTIRRRTYRGNGSGAASSVPIDEACGMRGRYMTPDVEEMATIDAAMVAANEVQKLLGKVLPVAPSATAIQDAVRQLGLDLDDDRNSAVSADTAMSLVANGSQAATLTGTLRLSDGTPVGSAQLAIASSLTVTVDPNGSAPLVLSDRPTLMFAAGAASATRSTITSTLTAGTTITPSTFGELDAADVDGDGDVDAFFSDLTAASRLLRKVRSRSR